MRQIVVRVDKISADPSETVSSPDEIVGVEDMSDCYLIELTDGSLIWVTGDSSAGFMNGLRRRWLQSKTVCRFLFDRVMGRPARLVALKMDSTSARHLFWLLQPGMGVIY
jgi:hypothetical protein